MDIKEKMLDFDHWTLELVWTMDRKGGGVNLDQVAKTVHGVGPGMWTISVQWKQSVSLPNGICC